MVDLLRPVLDQIAKLWARLALMPVIRWGTVTQTDPLRVTLDGDADAVPFTPQTVVKGIPLGRRVVCVEQHRRLIIIAVTGWADDTGWVNIAPGPGFTAPTPIAVRRIGDQVHFKGDLTRTAGNLPTSSTGVTAFTLPDAMFRPVSYARRPSGAWGSTSANGSWLIFSASTNTVVAFGVGASFDQIYLGGITYLNK